MRAPTARFWGSGHEPRLPPRATAVGRMVPGLAEWLAGMAFFDAGLRSPRRDAARVTP